VKDSTRGSLPVWGSAFSVELDAGVVKSDTKERGLNSFKKV
jgi:hypothetical protein